MKKITFINKLRIVSAIVLGALAVGACTMWICLFIYNPDNLTLQNIVSALICMDGPLCCWFLFSELLDAFEEDEINILKRLLKQILQ